MRIKCSSEAGSKRPQQPTRRPAEAELPLQARAVPPVAAVADHGVPAVSFARGAPGSQSNIHSRYDTYELLSDRRIRDDAGFISDFTAFMADSFKCPVKREIPDKIKEDLDKYLVRKR